MKITQAFTREEENRGIYEKLNKKCSSDLDEGPVHLQPGVVLCGQHLHLGGGRHVPHRPVDAGARHADRHPNCHFLLRLAVLAAHFEPVQPVQHLSSTRWPIWSAFEMIDEPVTVDDAPGATELPPHHRPVSPSTT